jgi:hypothetical protein
MNHLLAWGAAAAVAVAVVGCGGKTEVKADPQMEQDLKACRTALSDKQELLALLEKENADLKLGSTTDEVVVKIEGNVLEVAAGSAPGPNRRAEDPKGDAKDAELYDAFVNQVKGSRSAIKLCYQSALKKNTQLQARTVPLTITVDFTSGGAMSSAVFNPRISATFDKCMEAVARGWKLPAAPRKISFQSTVTLTPE